MGTLAVVTAVGGDEGFDHLRPDLDGVAQLAPPAIPRAQNLS